MFVFALFCQVFDFLCHSCFVNRIVVLNFSIGIKVEVFLFVEELEERNLWEGRRPGGGDVCRAV